MHGEGSRGAAEQGVEADEAWLTSELRSLTPVLGRPKGAGLRWMAIGTMGVALTGCSIEPSPSPKATPLPAIFEPAQACIELPFEPAIHAATGRECVPTQFAEHGLPLEVTVRRGNVTSFRFYSQCVGRVYEVDPGVRRCIRAALKGWRFDYMRPQCPGTASRAVEEETFQFYLMPVGHAVPHDQLASGVGEGCAAG
jgi:hypothetical protein